MSDNQKKKGNARRKLLKGIAAGSGAFIAGKSLPDSWSRPVVDSVILPVHAQTSGVYAGTNRDIGLLQGAGLLVSLSEKLVPDAKAGPPPPVELPPSSVDVSYCFWLNEDRTAADIQLIVTAYDASGITGCNVNLLSRLMNVPVGGGPVQVPPPEQNSCGGISMSWNKYLQESIPAKGVIAKLGLISDAAAGGDGGEFPTIEITDVNGTVNGIFDFFGFVDNFTIGLGNCQSYTPLCTNECPQ